MAKTAQRKPAAKSAPPAPTGNRKVLSSVLGGAIVTVGAILSKDIWAYEWTTELQGAVTTIVMAVLVYFVSERKS